LGNRSLKFSERFVFIPSPGDELALSILDISECTEAIELHLINPIRMIEWIWSASEAHRLECGHLAHARIMAFFLPAPVGILRLITMFGDKTESKLFEFGQHSPALSLHRPGVCDEPLILIVKMGL
jgi:hypothetical protein